MPNNSLLNRIPDNKSLLQPTKYLFTFPDMPFLKYFLQNINLPDVGTNAVTVPNLFANTYRHGDKLVYSPLRTTAIIDEDLRTWEETYDWLVALTSPEKWSQYAKYYNENGTLYHDGLLTILTNANQPNIRFKFMDCHPVSITGINFSTADSADTIITCDVEFRYDIFQIDRL